MRTRCPNYPRPMHHSFFSLQTMVAFITFEFKFIFSKSWHALDYILDLWPLERDIFYLKTSLFTNHDEWF